MHNLLSIELSPGDWRPLKPFLATPVPLSPYRPFHIGARLLDDLGASHLSCGG